MKHTLRDTELADRKLGSGQVGRWVCSCGKVSHWMDPRYMQRGHDMHARSLTAQG